MSLWSRLKNVIHPESHQNEIREELDFHLEMDRDNGHDSRHARLRLGNLTSIQEEVRAMRSIPTLESIWRDVRLAVRSLARAKTMASTVVATLAISIGATVAIFSVVNGVLLKPLPYPEPEQLVSLSHSLAGEPVGSADFLYVTYAEQSRVFRESGVWAARAATITGHGDPEQVPAAGVSVEVLPLLGIAPARGRLFQAADYQADAPPTAILTYGYWQSRFGGDERVVGQTLMIDSLAHQIVGILPREFRFLDVSADLFRPVQINRNQIVQGNFSYNAIARLKEGVSLDQARTDMARMIQIAIDSFPTPGGITREQIRQRGLTPSPKLLKETVIGNVGDTLWILMGAVGVVLLIACANVTNLFLVRSESRQRELAVRSALGASRLRLATGLFTEAMILSTVGGLLGFAAAYGGLRFLLQSAPATLPRIAEISLDGDVVTFAALVTLGTAILFGLTPALRHASPRPILATGGRTMSTGREGRCLRATLVIAQVGLALVLLIASGLMLRTYRSLLQVDPGFQSPETLQLAHIAFPRGPDFNVVQAAQSLRQMVEATEAIPGVTSAAFAISGPLEGGGVTSTLFTEGFEKEGQLPPVRIVKFATPKYFRTVGVPLLAGRDLEWVDHFDGRNVAIASESLAKEVWGSPQAALGKRVRTNPSDPWREIVGVAGDVRETGISQPITPAVYFPVLMRSFWSNKELFWGLGALIVRSSRAGTEGLLQDVQRAVWSVNSGIPLATPTTAGELYRRSMARTSFAMVLISVAGLMALFLGIVGIYGVIAYTVEQRRREVGIRVALGASTQGVRWLFVRQALALVATGTSFGLAGAFGLTRLMDSLLYGVRALDPVTFLLVPTLLAGIAAVASYLPARRVLRMGPAQTLREE
jgi:putative ABC transport system permease protein